MIDSKNSASIQLFAPSSGENTTAPRKRADAVANRKLILATAQRLFHENGVENVTMSEVARAAQVGKGTLYRAVANKGELCFALMDEDLRLFQNQIFGMLNEMHTIPALGKLTKFLDRLTRFFDVHSLLMLEAQAHGLSLAIRGPINQTSLHGWFHQTVVKLVQKAQLEGTVSAEADAAYLSDLILAPLNPTLFRHQRHVVGLSLDEMSLGLRQFVLHGIVSKTM
ncbi:MAG: TetR/AcrR family transcriptional regulator [Candidatus Promineifilaceae bacterium]